MNLLHNIWSNLKIIPSTNTWLVVQRFFLVAIGSFIATIGYSVFQVPFNIVAGGVSGIGIIINHYTGWSVGTMFFVLNIPLLIIGYFNLGKWRFLTYTLLSVTVFAVGADIIVSAMPHVLDVYPITDDQLLSAIYAGIVYGIGFGLISRAGGSIGGTTVIARIIQKKTGLPLSQIFLYTDGAVILLAGLIFGWESALIALLSLFVNGMATDFVLEGPSNVRTAMIITSHPDKLIKALMYGLDRSISFWPVTGGYSGTTRSMIYCTVQRTQVSDLKYIVAETEPEAFLVIENAHQAMGTGFMKLKR